ncbi:MAG TPA: Hpt domain-containing protein, partial [Candidatus Polarisedimenticolia bacterium]|nr:Hpt domain-containing protein [Candidatus Polarisedimenticolia bacterium]
MVDTGERYERERLEREFLPEAEERLDALAAELQALRAGRVGGRIDPQTVNTLFRHVHSLKGLAGIFDLQMVVNLAHDLEDLLDRLRTGRAEVTDGALTLLEEAASALSRMVLELSSRAAPRRADSDRLDSVALGERLRGETAGALQGSAGTGEGPPGG